MTSRGARPLRRRQSGGSRRVSATCDSQRQRAVPQGRSGKRYECARSHRREREAPPVQSRRPLRPQDSPHCPCDAPLLLWQRKPTERRLKERR